jgi:hypothetical protein
LWINPDNSSHQRTCASGNFKETFDAWSSISSTVAVPGFPLATQMCQMNWSGDYSWSAHIRQDVNATNVYAAELAAGGYSNRGGANAGTPPYTDSVPNVIESQVNFAFWAGKGA